MNETVAVIMPAYRAEQTIAASAASVLAQSYPHFQLLIVSDDGVDYAELLGRQGLADKRILQLSSGVVGSGASAARNLALEASTAPYAAILDADDRFKPEKLALAVAALADQAIVSTALDVMTDQFVHLRHVAMGPDRLVKAGAHKWLNLSMDSMIVWDRRRTDGRYDTTLSNMTDLELLLQLYRTVPQSWHLGTPLHDYIKRSNSMSNGANVAAGMIASKTAILSRVETGYYGLSEADAEGVAAFLRISLEAEKRYGGALAARPGLLFEDHLEPMLAAAKAGPAGI
ncbi:Glycosyl transferase, group 2 family protein [Devosia sp. LC5]|uniref:glycosyltransferase family 2 protein n=1 Tax=Devosia sp. LC5 TaxID=1502724 RepID=UPI0004E3651C|nr:glycosyltransferase family 2 protein [Devosia sp. LC5]KFC68744.1 Glycosyl transferase, group 2 family protein [Devosia sp. LC5]